MKKVTIQNGNREVTLSVVGSRFWAAGDKKRVYFDLETSGKRSVVGQLYEAVSGGTSDLHVEVQGRTFGYKLGIDSGSKTKRESIREGVKDLAAQLCV